MLENEIIKLIDYYKLLSRSYEGLNLNDDWALGVKAVITSVINNLEECLNKCKNERSDNNEIDKNDGIM